MVEQPQVTPDYLEERINDWKMRLEGLYTLICNWARDNNLNATPSHVVEMNEELMQKNGIPATSVPTLEIKNDDNIVISIIPKGLWVIGANGRVDLICSKGTFMLVDAASVYEAPNWKLFGPSIRDGRAFETSQLNDLL